MTSTKCQASESDLASRSLLASHLTSRGRTLRDGGGNKHGIAVVVCALWEPSRGWDKDLKPRQMTLTAKH